MSSPTKKQLAKSLSDERAISKRLLSENQVMFRRLENGRELAREWLGREPLDCTCHLCNCARFALGIAPKYEQLGLSLE